MSGFHTFLSEYHPQSSVVMEAIAPPGVDKIKVCLDLTNDHSVSRLL